MKIACGLLHVWTPTEGWVLVSYWERWYPRTKPIAPVPLEDQLAEWVALHPAPAGPSLLVA